MTRQLLLFPEPETRTAQAIAVIARLRPYLSRTPGWESRGVRGPIRTKRYGKGLCPLEAAARLKLGKSLTWLSAGKALGIERPIIGKIADAADFADPDPVRAALLEACGLPPASTPA